MANNPENKEVRAIFLPGEVLPSEERIIRGGFVGSSGDAYGGLMMDSHQSARKRLVAASVTDAYEMAFGKECPFLGPQRDAYARQAIDELGGYDLTVVSPKEFEIMVRDQGLLNG